MAPEYVAIDLETTGLDLARDAIIEIGAVRFTLDGVTDRFTTLVSPGRAVAPAVLDLTGISETEIAAAPLIAVVAGDFERFMEGAQLVGHNVCGFDLRFLDAAEIAHPSVVHDTQQIASIVARVPGGYSLVNLARHYGIDFPVRHRALADAEAAAMVFLRLWDSALEMPTRVLGQIAQWLTPTAWPCRSFFASAWEASQSAASPVRPMVREPGRDGLSPVRPRPNQQAIGPDEPLAVLDQASVRTDVISAFDRRDEQRRMVEAVTNALNGRERLMVEAGTGTGKSLAYLIPAACHAAANGTRVVISTSTINLQEQLVGQDIPAVKALMPRNAVSSCLLKGRRNYLCLNRFQSLQSSPALTDDEALAASKILAWLGETETGDRAELRLSPQEAAVWARISAEGADCTIDTSPYVVDGTCFLQRARKRAEASHLVVVNHALLLSDAGTGGRVLPPYQHLIVDEAHHLEDEATRQFGFACGQRDLTDLLNRCEAFHIRLSRSLRGVNVGVSREVSAAASALAESVKGSRQHIDALCLTLADFHGEQASTGDDGRLHITRAMRVQPGWSGVELAWHNASLVLREIAERLRRLHEEISAAKDLGLLSHDLTASDVSDCYDRAIAHGAGMAAGIENEDAGRVVWLETDRRDSAIALAWVPLEVAHLLRDGLYAEERTVVLTGATLAVRGGFEYLQERLGLEDCGTLALGSPFDYRRAALALIPRDMPEPDSPQFMDALAASIIDLARASEGRALALFTSHAMLRAVHGRVSAPLREHGVRVLGQGIDGSPKHLVEALKDRSSTIVLGTASLWEGVDVPGDALSLLIVARLPFAVPTDPIVAARSEVYEDPFGQYSLPQAVIRFRQGFGRLIRSKTDRGVIVVLDRRIVSRQYGSTFLQSLPGCPVRQVALRDLAGVVGGFLAPVPVSA